MDSLLISLRILHIISCTFVVGATAYGILVLGPRIGRTPPRHAVHVRGLLNSATMLIYIVNGVIVIGTGAAMTLIMWEGALDKILSTGWGWAILIGFVATVAAAVVGPGFGMMQEIPRPVRLARGIKGPAPSLRKLSN